MNYHEERRQLAAAQARYDAMMPHEYEPTDEEIREAALEEAQQELAEVEWLLEEAVTEHEELTITMIHYMDRVRRLKAKIAELENTQYRPLSERVGQVIEALGSPEEMAARIIGGSAEALQQHCAQFHQALDASHRIQESLTQQIEDLRLQVNTFVALQANKEIEYCNRCGDRLEVYDTVSGICSICNGYDQTTQENRQCQN